MADDKPTVTPAVTEAPPAGTATTPAVTEPTPQAGSGETMSLDEAKKLRSEANSLRKRLKELEDAKNAEETAKLSEVEKAKKEMVKVQAQAELLSAELRAERVARAIERSAIKLGLDPELASSLVKSDELEFDDAGLPTNAEKVLEALVKRWPQLVSKPADAQAALGGGKPRPAITATPKPVLPGQKLSDEERRKRAWHPRNL